MNHNYTPEDVERILKTFVTLYAVDIPAKFIDDVYYVPFGELEYALEFPRQDWIEAIANSANASE